MDDPVERLFERASAHKVPMYEVCDRAKVARSTPSRWKNDKNGATYETIKRLETALSEIIEARAAASSIQPSPGDERPFPLGGKTDSERVAA